MTALRLLTLAAGLLGLVGPLNPLVAGPTSAPVTTTPSPLAPIHLGSIPTPAMPSALIPPPATPCQACQATIVVPPLPMGYELHACPGGCGKSAEKKVCTAQEDFKKHAVYEVKEVEYCVPKVSLYGSGGSECGEVRTKKVLVKKMVPDEKPTKKCVVQTVHEPLPTPVAPAPFAPHPPAPHPAAPVCGVPATSVVMPLPILLPAKPVTLPEKLPESQPEKKDDSKDDKKDKDTDKNFVQPVGGFLPRIR